MLTYNFKAIYMKQVCFAFITKGQVLMQDIATLSKPDEGAHDDRGDVTNY